MLISEVKDKINKARQFWSQRNKRFKEWYEILLLIDTLASRNMESYVSSEPMSFYNMAHYLLTRGELLHLSPIESESAFELDRRARLNRACASMWSIIDRQRQLCGNEPFIDELGFYLLVLGWYSIVLAFDKEKGILQAQLWNPYDTYPTFSNNKLRECVHSYSLSEEEAKVKAEENDWYYKGKTTPMANVVLDDYFLEQDGILCNIIFIDGVEVTSFVERPEMKLLIAPIAGFPDKGSLTPGTRDWKQLAGRSIFEVNSSVINHFNKWKSQISQILRDTSQPVVEEFSATPQATPEQLRERGAFFHYAPGEQGIVRVPPAVIPIEVQAHLIEIRRELQKGSFSDAVYGMMEGQAGYALSLLATSSANQILYPYMDAKHFVIGEADSFWLTNLKTSRRVFDIKGKVIEKLKPVDIPEDVSIVVESDVATPKDWLERATIGNSLDKHLDTATIIGEIYKLPDPQAIRRRKDLERMLEHPMSQLVEMIAGYQTHADYLEKRGDIRQANLFRRAAQALESQLGAPAPGQGKPEEMSRVLSEREAGAPAERTRVSSTVAPPELQQGFTPMQLRQIVGEGKMRRVK